MATESVSHQLIAAKSLDTDLLNIDRERWRRHCHTATVTTF